MKINLVVLPVRDEFRREKISVPKALYANNEWSVNKLINRIIEVLNGRKYNYNLKTKKIRLWKLTEGLGFDQALSLLDNDKENIIRGSVQSICLTVDKMLLIKRDCPNILISKANTQ
jgi:hypothetical protein